MKYLVALLALALLTADVPSSGVPSYIRTKTDSTDSAHCLYWPRGTVTFKFDQQGNDTVNGGTEFDAMRTAWASWQTITNGQSNLNLTDGGKVADRTIGYNPNGSNENVVLFRHRVCADFITSTMPCMVAGSCGNTYDCWEHDSATIALTTTTFEVNTGKLFDADVEFNSDDGNTSKDQESFYFTTNSNAPCRGTERTQNCIAYDVQATMTHEAGHFLGLDHDPNYVDPAGIASVMNPNSGVGQIGKRTVDQGSVQFVRDVYPAGKDSRDCVASKGGCAVGGTGEALFWMVGLVGLWLQRTHRDKKARRSHSG